MNKLFQFSLSEKQINPALLFLRLWTGISLFIRHGIEKLTGFSQMKLHFPDPLHIGVMPGLWFAFLTDVICSVLVALGLFTRLASLLIVFNLTVAFIFFHHWSIMNILGEQAYVYLGVYVALSISGPGKYSMDQFLGKRKKLQ